MIVWHKSSEIYGTIFFINLTDSDDRATQIFKNLRHNCIMCYTNLQKFTVQFYY